MIPVLVIIGVLLLILILVWLIYNGLVQAKNVVKEAYSGIDIQLKKRFNLIPSLIEVTKAYNEYEAETLLKIVEQRSSKGISDTVKDTAQADQSVTLKLKQFRINFEAYPDLKANSQFNILMDNLSLVENELAMSRRYYNGAIRDFNIKIEVFPSVLIAKKMGFTSAEFYKVEVEERVVPEVNLS